jgi:hypothetical protein
MPMQAQWEGKGIGLLFLKPRRYKGVGGRRLPRRFYTRKRATVPIVEEAGWAPGLVWMGMEKRKYFTTPGFETRTHSLA